jgi:GNAT superfamily N-acetyltransferase
MTITTSARTLHPVDGPVLDALLAGWALPAAYARSHLREHGLALDTVRAIGCALPPDHATGGLAAALVAHDGIGWALWREPTEAAALAAALPFVGPTLLSGPRVLVEPLLAYLPPDRVSGVDRCPFERLVPGNLRPPPAAAGPAPVARRATLGDMDPLIDFYMRGFYSLAHYPTRAAWRARLTSQITYRSLYLIEQDGMVVSAAQSSAETSAVAMIGGVATVAAYRNRGLSAICVHALCTALFAAGVREIGLFYMPANAPAARVYQKLGFRGDDEWWLQRLNYW